MRVTNGKHEFNLLEVDSYEVLVPLELEVENGFLFVRLKKSIESHRQRRKKTEQVIPKVKKKWGDTGWSPV